MRIAVATLALIAGAAAPAQAARVDLMVVGAHAVVRDAAPVTLKAATVKIGRRRCAVGAATPLGALVRTPVRSKLALRDYGACSKKPRDASGLYVRGIGKDVEKGRDGWVYKVGHKAPGVGAADSSARLRAGTDVLWFWCRSGADGCQRTLAVRPERTTAAAGEAVRVTVTAYDDDGRGVPAAGATVALGAASAQAGADGVAELTVPAGSATLSVVATKAGTVRSFPAEVRVA